MKNILPKYRTQKLIVVNKVNAECTGCKSIYSFAVYVQFCENDKQRNRCCNNKNRVARIPVASSAEYAETLTQHITDNS